MVLADMKLAGTIPTDVVLFNIDSKSEVNGKQSKVAIVSVLQNVFNEMQGFSGSNPFLADLERNLTEEGKYDLFKEKFEDSFGSAWEESRSDFDFIQDDVVEVLDEAPATINGRITPIGCSLGCSTVSKTSHGAIMQAFLPMPCRPLRATHCSLNLQTENICSPKPLRVATASAGFRLIRTARSHCMSPH